MTAGWRFCFQFDFRFSVRGIRRFDKVSEDKDVLAQTFDVAVKFFRRRAEIETRQSIQWNPGYTFE